MVHLVKKGEKFYVIETAANHEIIKTSQSTGITTRKGAIKNIRASMKQYDCGYLFIQDNTNDMPHMLRITPNSVIKAEGIKVGKKFVLGARKSPGKKAATKK